MTRVVFMGTPASAVPTLRELSARFNVVLVVTQPDRPRGRSRTPQPPPVKTVAEEMGLTVAQPGSAIEIADSVRAVEPFDVGVVTAYGRILRPEVLALPTHGFLNVHFSLLPRWRGATPVRRALMAGDTMTGVTIIRMDEGLDTGPVLTAQAVDVLPEENAGRLESRLAEVGGRLLANSVAPYLEGTLSPVPQSEEGLTYAAKLEAGERAGETAENAARFVDLVRGLAPSPAATLVLDGIVHKILEARVAETEVQRGRWELSAGRLLASAWPGSAEIISLQPPGKNPQSGDDWVRGRHKDSGSVGPV